MTRDEIDNELERIYESYSNPVEGMAACIEWTMNYLESLEESNE